MDVGADWKTEADQSMVVGKLQAIQTHVDQFKSAALTSTCSVDRSVEWEGMQSRGRRPGEC